MTVGVLPATAPHGIVERVSVYTINRWELLTTAILLRAHSRQASVSGLPTR